MGILNRPCKSRKVKCDESRPTCVNCQRQGETCDYSIRLNWGGRGKRKGEDGAAQGMVNFSMGMISTGSSRPIKGDATATPSPSQISFQGSFAGHPQLVETENDSLPPSNIDYSNQSSVQDPSASPAPNFAQGPASDMSMIDPALTGSPIAIYHDSIYGEIHGREHQYTQSYERYRSLTPGTPMSIQPPSISRLRQAQDDSLLSPTDSIRSPLASTSNRSTALPNIDSPTPTPPFYSNGIDDSDVTGPEIASFDRPLKRVRYQAGLDMGPVYDSIMPPPNFMSFPSYNIGSQASSINTVAPPSSVGTPLTPASNHSDEGYKIYQSKLSPHATQDSPDLRRLSVSSLLSGPPGMPYQNDRTSRPNNNPEAQDWSVLYQDVYQDTITYGIDRGFKDLDIGKNDDMNAITGSSPIAMRDHLELVVDEEGELMPVEFGFGMETNNTAFENGGYYDKSVPICISRALEPLPNKLLENPMNLLVCNHCIICHDLLSNILLVLCKSFTG
jgi:hypothetical protein